MVRSAPAFLEEDSNGWLVAFSDLVLQLFAFVMVAAVLGSRALPEERPAMRVPSAAPFAIEVADPAPVDALSLARFDELPPRATAPSMDAPTAMAEPPSIVYVEGAAPVEAPVRAAPIAPIRSLAAELETFVAAAGLGEAVQVAVNGGGVTLSISDTIGFASGSADLLPDAAPVLVEVRGLIGIRPELVVEVAGHTDDRPLHGGAFGSNLELSLARAARVARELAAGDDGLTARIFVAGYGAQRPVASNDDADGRAHNRRVELRLVPAADAALDPPLVRPARMSVAAR